MRDYIVGAWNLYHHPKIHVGQEVTHTERPGSRGILLDTEYTPHVMWTAGPYLGRQTESRARLLPCD